uniref:GDP-D-glucose phosphorylase 1 n=2 Tax=Graphocephala atropunctata TaxID=36148 RepID=A0A1B6LSQ1_9HEMI
MTSTHEYSETDFVYLTQWNSNEMSKFDEVVTNKWIAMHKEGSYFRYKLKMDESKVIPGKYQYLAQLNLNRALHRRKPTEMQNMQQNFDKHLFNFTKMDKKEILFQILNKNRKNIGNYLAINVSPLEFGHCLLLPALYSCLPQVVTADGLLAAVELFLLTRSPALRMGFNGLCAHASINHYHFHFYYLQQQMLLETIEVEHLAGPCYMLLSFPSQGFVFQLSPHTDIQEFVRYVFKLVSFLQDNEKPHNIFLTRGSSFQEKTPNLVRDHVRLYVWARKPVLETKEDAMFYPALCEMFGQLAFRRREDYETVTEEVVANIMSDLTEEPFQSVVDQVRAMFQNLNVQ